MSSTAIQRVRDVFARFEARDVAGVVGQFTEDGVFADPHYPPPIGPSMTGHQAIRAGITWSLTLIEQPGFTVRHELTSDGSGRVGALEVDTNHRLYGGAVLAFTQVFIAEMGDHGLLLRMQSYTSYPPPSSP